MKTCLDFEGGMAPNLGQACLYNSDLQLLAGRVTNTENLCPMGWYFCLARLFTYIIAESVEKRLLLLYVSLLPIQWRDCWNCRGQMSKTPAQLRLRYLRNT